MNVSSLTALLSLFGVNTETWGKTVDGLLKEIENGEGHLVVNRSGLVRRVNMVRIFIHRGENYQQCLFEVEQHYHGNHRSRNCLPSEKMMEGESPVAALARGLKKELHFSPEEYDILVVEPPQLQDVNQKTSYPGLKTQYMVHAFHVGMKLGFQALREDRFTVIEQKDVWTLFEWRVVS